MSDQHNSVDEEEDNMNRSISDEPNFTLADVYDVEYYEKIMDKSICDVPKITLSDVSTLAIYERARMSSDLETSLVTKSEEMKKAVIGRKNQNCFIKAIMESSDSEDEPLKIFQNSNKSIRSNGEKIKFLNKQKSKHSSSDSVDEPHTKYRKFNHFIHSDKNLNSSHKFSKSIESRSGSEDESLLKYSKKKVDNSIDLSDSGNEPLHSLSNKKKDSSYKSKKKPSETNVKGKVKHSSKKTLTNKNKSKEQTLKKKIVDSDDDANISNSEREKSSNQQKNSLLSDSCEDEPFSNMKKEAISSSDSEDEPLHKSSTKKSEKIQKDSGSSSSSFVDENEEQSSGKNKSSKRKQANDSRKINMHHRQSVDKYKKYTANKNDLSDELEIVSSNSSSGRNLPSPDSSVEWKMPSPVHSDMSEMHSPDTSDKSSDDSNTSNEDYDSSDSSYDYRASKKKKNHQKSKVAVKKKNYQKPKKELSEYEKMIQKNRDEKLAFLQSLRMDEVKEDLNEAIKKMKPKRIYRKKEHNRNLSPTRKSVRLKKVDINLSEEAIQARAQAKAEKEAEAGIVKELPRLLTFEEALAEDYDSDDYAEFVSDFDDLDCMIPEPFTDYVSYFNSMKIDQYKIAQFSKRKISAMAIHPMTEKVIVSAGKHDGSIGFWHVHSESVPYMFKPHLYTVSCLKFNSDSMNQITSCSYDGTMRCGDMEKRVFYEVFNPSKEASCSYFDFISPTTTVVSHKSGNVSLVDIRSKRKSAEQWNTCHDSSVTTVSVHPVDKNYFVSADVKGFLSLWDLRMWKINAVRRVNRNYKSITSAFFSPVTGNSILTTSADDSLCLYDCSKLGSHALSFDKLLRGKNLTGNATATFQATWLPNTDDAFVIGSNEFPKRIKIFNNKLENIYNFQDLYLNSFTPINVFHPSLPVLAGANCQGKVCIFS